jgi:CRISPR-associated protein Csd2
MSSLSKKIDFAVIVEVNRANPNGDPLNGNRPRTDNDSFGEISDVCLKRKIRDRLLEAGHAIFVQSDDRKIDNMTSLKARAESDEFGLGKEVFKTSDSDEKLPKKAQIAKKACEKWFDIRTFGQLFAFGKESKKSKKSKDPKDSEDSDAAGVSIPIRGPVTIHSAYSVEPINITSIQITKSVNSEGDGSKRGADTMGMKHRVDKGIYVFYGSMSAKLAERTGFSDEDAEIIKGILPKLFENDASSARPEGSITVLRVFWWRHNCSSGQYSSYKVHKSLTVNPDGSCDIDRKATPGLEAEIIPGF